MTGRQTQVVKASPVDAITQEIVNGKLLATVDEMAIVLARTSMSPVVYEVLDFACGICNAEGELVAQTNGITIFTGTFSRQVQFIRQRFGADVAPGDTFLTNDPFEGGTHACDFAMIRPIFARGAVIAYGIAVAHILDVGGAVAGSIPPDANSIYQEGLRLSGVRLTRKDMLLDDIVRIITENVRLPQLTLGDINAELAAVRIAERRITETVAKYGTEALVETFRQLLETSEAHARAVISALPDGDYPAEDIVDGDGVSDDAIEPSNEGWFRPLRVTAPPGTIFTAEKPSPTGWYYEGAAQASELVWKALAPLAPERFTAGTYLSLCATYISGSGQDGLFVHIEPQNGGWGATRDRDGANGLIAITDGDTYNYSIELLEAKFPLLVKRYDYNVEGGVGAGKHRGGFGLAREYEIESDDAVLYCSLGRTATPPWGVDGGLRGSLNGIEVTRGTARVRLTRTPRFALRRGDLVRIITGGGGGWGDPLERNPADIASDIVEGLLTPQQAASIYRVTVDADGNVAPAATVGFRESAR